MNSLSEITIRPIQAGDNPKLALIIRNTLAEFGAANPGTVFFDPTTDALFELFQAGKSAYFVAEIKLGRIGQAQQPGGQANVGVDKLGDSPQAGLFTVKFAKHHGDNARNAGQRGL